eukprot:gb/GECG01000916.1/.p1 GENE.gb/GECG01000916.1/~~gb/GECG01000916.1/.p1  ORF type:complete len:267 (+),score=9.24 gb/GECG01000916.1/:1-801(+)
MEKRTLGTKCDTFVCEAGIPTLVTPDMTPTTQRILRNLGGAILKERLQVSDTKGRIVSSPRRDMRAVSYSSSIPYYFSGVRKRHSAEGRRGNAYPPNVGRRWYRTKLEAKVVMENTNCWYCSECYWSSKPCEFLAVIASRCEGTVGNVFRAYARRTKLILYTKSQHTTLKATYGIAVNIDGVFAFPRESSYVIWTNPRLANLYPEKHYSCLKSTALANEEFSPLHIAQTRLTCIRCSVCINTAPTGRCSTNEIGPSFSTIGTPSAD